MEISILEYMSTNGIRFHHILSNFNKGEIETLRPETHYLYEVFILLSGKATYSVNGQLFPLKPQDIILVPPNAVHSINFDNKRSCERMVLSFLPELLPNFANIDLLSTFKKAASQPIVISAKHVKQFTLFDVFEECKNVCRQKSTQADMFLLGIILKFIARLNELLQYLSKNADAKDPTTKTHSLSYLCIQYINSHLTENISINDISKALQFSVSHIRQTFKKESGLTLHNYIFIQKMQLAHQLLQQGKNPVSVASELGYDYYSTFYHNYVKRFRTPPKALSATDYQRFFGEEVKIPAKPSSTYLPTRKSTKNKSQ